MLYDSFTLVNVQAWQIVWTMDFPFLVTKGKNCLKFHHVPPGANCKVSEFLWSMRPFLDKIWLFKALILMKLMTPAAGDKTSFRIFAEPLKFTVKCGASSGTKGVLPHPWALPTRNPSLPLSVLLHCTKSLYLFV